ncbi:MAG: translation initiation factor IF-2 [Parabacteroides sp.]
MPIKLIQVQRKLNVGITTVVAFLQRKGFEVENNPNTRISDEQYALLVKEFGKDLPKGETPRDSHPQKDRKPKREERPQEIKTVVPDEYKPKIVTKGRIDLEGEHKKQTDTGEKTTDGRKDDIVEKRPQAETVETVQTEKAERKQPQVVVNKAEETVNIEKKEAAMPADKGTATSGGEELFRLNTPKFESKIKVTGKIDLNAINQSTRPRKKSKEEKRKERDEKMRNNGANRPGQNNNAGKGPKENGAKVSTPGAASSKPGDAQHADKKKRSRIKKDRVDVANTPGTNYPREKREDRKQRLKKPVKTEVSEEDVQKQIKETLARLTNKGNKTNKGAKYRRDKRDAVQKREHELQELEEQESKILKLTEFVTANDLANMMDVPVTKVIATCMSIGIMVSINQRLDAETINIVAEEFGFKTEYVSADVVEAIKADEEDDNEDDWVPRPPIVTVMGHVDHGKTSLLDNIRNANVIAGEAGGITQHIGAYNVKLPSGRRITFLDTPGHEAFTAMRARGAKVTDIAIIIVAADDSVMPQTVEAINHASAAGVPIVFAINKIDKPHANPDKIKEELANMNYLVEDWGGKYQSQEISAKKGIGVEDLLEKVLLEADLLDLKANPNRRAVGSIIESSLDKGRGYVSTVLVENGTLKIGDIVLAGTHFGRVKAMFNERNQRIEKAGPSEPALILGLNGAPQAGDTFNVLETEQEAREIANRREQLQRELGLRTQKMLTLDDIGRRIAVGNFQELNVIVKGDVDGSVEALSDSLIRLSTEEIQVNVIHKAVGQISESDVVLAAASNAVIIGFQVRPSQPARKSAEREGVEIRLYSIIYDAIEDVKDAMEGMLSPEIKEEITANVEVQQVFKISKVGTVAGCIVKEGKIKRSNKIRLIRDGIVIYSGELGSLKRFKDDVKEVVAGLDCGLNITNFNDIQVGDVIEAYEETEIKKTL